VEAPHECHVDMLEPVRSDANRGTVASLFIFLVLQVLSIFFTFVSFPFLVVARRTTCGGAARVPRRCA